jgi:pimeloyl-ACP methyl ester carboxylesterase
MPHIARPDGTRIYYEVRGAGCPLLLFAPGGINSQVSFWANSPVNPFDFADEFMVIGMDQRNAEHSPAPLAAPTWEDHVADQLAVLDAVGVERALLWGGCIGVAYVLRFIQEAPQRVIAAVGQNPVGLYDGVNTRHTFFKMFEPTIAASEAGGMRAVVDAALRDPLFVRNNAGGPFAARIAADRQFRDEALALDPGEYARIIGVYDAQMWGAKGAFMSVEESFVRACPVPLLILPGTDEFHPTEIAARICADAPRATCLPPDWGRPEKVAGTRERVLSFLREQRNTAQE